MSKIYQALEALTQGFKPRKETMTQRKSILTLALGLCGIASLLMVSYLNNSLFLGQLLAVSAIITCVLFVKTVGDS